MPSVSYDSSSPSTTVREKILELAVSELAEQGTEFFRTPLICERLHISRSLVNHHFGDQMGLTAEAAVVSYERYVEKLRLAASTKRTPASRLEAWMEAQHEWFASHRGTAALLQMPHPRYAELMRSRFEARLKDAFRLNMAVLATLVRDVKRGQVSPLAFDIESAPFDELLGQSMENLMRTASVGMSSMGASVWAAGHTMPSRDMEENHLETPSLTQHRKWVVRAIIAT